MHNDTHAYLERISQIHQILGIPSNYAHDRELDLQLEATSLVDAEHGNTGNVMQLTPETNTMWRRMKMAASHDGIHLLMISGYRSLEYQSELIRKKLDKGEAIDTILKILAPPGYSEHHTGRAIDITSPDCPPCIERFEKTDAFSWLQTHAREYDFVLSYPRDNRHGFLYEPWHWTYRHNADFAL